MADPLVKIEELHYAYPAVQQATSPSWILRGINLSVEEGQFLGIMGAIGAGKTTLAFALNGVVPQSTGGLIKGDVLVSGQNTKRVPVAELSQSVGIVFQDSEAQLFNMSVEAEIAFGMESLGIPRGEMEIRLNWALEVVGMQTLRDRSPDQLSGGQRKRLAIAAVLAMQPAILVLDEPTSHLDPAGTADLLQVIDQLRMQQGTTILMIEQESEILAEHADRIVVLDRGRIVRDGNPNEVLSDVAWLEGYGLIAPQVSELGACLQTRFGMQSGYSRLEDAGDVLREAILED